MPDEKNPEPETTEPISRAQEDGAGSQPRKRRPARRYSYEEWNAVYLAWRAGETGQNELARKFGIDADTISTWVRKGTPSMRRPSFEERYRERDRDVEDSDIVREAKAQATKRMADEILDERGQIRKGNLSVLKNLRITIGGTLKKAFDTFGTVDWNNLTAREYTSIIRMLTSAAAMVGKMESFFIGDPMEGDDIPEELQFTPEEISFFEKPENADQMPPGMTPQELGRKLAALTMVKPLKPGKAA